MCSRDINGPSERPGCWINPKEDMGPRVHPVIGDDVMVIMAMIEVVIVMEMMTDNDNIKIVQDEEAGQEATGPPEGIRDPSVQVVIIPRRRIVGDHRRPFVIVIVVNPTTTVW
jgi:hypothetical protein